MKVFTNVNRVPKETEQYIVARYVGNEWWFWGSWNNKEKANEVAEEIGGAVFEKEEA